MSGGGKTSQTTQQTTIPPEVLARYNSVNQQAQQTASRPFQQYSTSPSAFVAPINSEQQGGINQTNRFATAAQPYNQAATGYTLAGAAPVNAQPITGQSISQFMSPYLQTVLGSTAGLLNQNNQQQQEGALGSAINQGAFGGDRAGIAAANLEQQQNLGNANIYSGIANTGFNTALSAAQQQQGVNLGAAQANRAANQQTGQSLETLGNTVQGEGIAGGQAEQAAGATQQQTSQAGLTALYNQFLQQQSYPFQVDQFLANIAEGTGALSGSTTTTTQPQSIFSDERLKEDIEPIGKTFSGQNVVAFRYKGDPTKRIGLIAQDVEKRHPDAVSDVGGFKAVDYDKATAGDAARGHFYKGGLVPANDNRGHYAGGGLIDPGELAQLEASGTYGPYTQGGLYGGSAGGPPRGGLSYVPSANLPVGHLMTPQSSVAPPPSMLQNAKTIANLGSDVAKGVNSKDGQSIIQKLGLGKRLGNDTVDQLDRSGALDAESPLTSMSDLMPAMARGGFARVKRDIGGSINSDPYAPAQLGLDIPDDKPQNLSLPMPAAPPKQGDNSSFGDIGSLVKLGMMIAPMLATGGAVRKGYDGGGVVQDDTGLISPDPADDYARSVIGSLMKGPQATPEDDTDVEAPPGSSDAGATPAGGLGAAFMSPEAKGAPAPAQAASTAGASLPTDLSSTLKLIAKAEGTGHNPKSSANGPYQIIDPTFVGLYRQMFPQAAQGMSKQQILALRAGPQGEQLSAQMGPYLAKQNIAKLQGAGVEPSAPNVYLAHFLGPDGAIRVLRADPSTPMSQLVSPMAVAENASIMKGKTAADVVGWAGRRLQQVAGRAAGGKVRSGYADGGSPTDLDAVPAGPTAEGDAAGNAASVPIGEMTAQPAVHDPAAAPSPQKQRFMDSLKKPEVFIPLLTGLAAAASTPTVHPLMAIAEGLGAGAQAYQGQRQFGLEQQQVAQHGQEVGVLQAHQALEPQEIANQRLHAQSSALTAKVSALTTMLSNLSQVYHPVAQVGPDGATGYKDINGNFISATDFGRVRAGYMKEISDLTGLPSLPTGGSNASATPGPSVGGGVAPASGAGSVPAAGGDGAGGPVPMASGPGVGGGVGHPVASASQPGHGSGAVLPANAPIGLKVRSGAYMKSPVQLPSVDNSRLTPSDNPDVLKQQGWGLIQSGNPEQAAAGHQMIDRANGIESGSIIPNDVGGHPYNGYVAYNQALAQQNTVQQSYAQQKVAKNAAASEFSTTVPQAWQVQQALNRIYGETDTNRLTPEIADLVGKASSIPGLRDAITPAWQKYQAANDEATKETALQTMVQAAATHLGQGAPATTLSEASHTVPVPGMAPGSRYDLAAQQTALLRLKQDYVRDWNINKDQVNDVASYDNDWVAAHPIGQYEQWAYDHITPYAGMTPQQKAQHPRKPQGMADVAKYPPGTPYVVPFDGANARKGQILWK